MFQGTTLITLDDKGRLALPKRARDEAAADGVIVAARHPDGCLVLYPPSAWAPKRDALLKLPFSARGFVRLVLGSAEELKVDRAGRVLIPRGCVNSLDLNAKQLLSAGVIISSSGIVHA